MVLCPYCVQDLPFRSAPFPHRSLLVLCSLLWVLTGVQGRRTLLFDTISFSDVTPCNPVTFSWTGGAPPFTLYIVDVNTGNAAQEFDTIEGDFFDWTPPQRAVGKVLYAFLSDDDDFDDTNNFVVQSASCFSAIPSATQTTTAIPFPPTTASAPTHPPDTPPASTRSSSNYP